MSPLPKIGAKYQFLILNISDNIQSTSLKMSDVVGMFTSKGNIHGGFHLMVDVPSTSTYLSTNRCWTRAMGGEQGTHIGGGSLI